MKKVLPYIAIIGAMSIWAGSGIAVKSALLAFSPLTLIILRFTLAVLLMLIAGLATGNLQWVQKKDIPLFCLLGFFEPFLYFILETYSYSCFDSPTIAEAMLSTSPVFAPIAAYLILHEQVTRNNIIGIIISTLGMALLILAGSQNFSIGNMWGVPLSIVTVLTAVGFTIVLRKIDERYSSLSVVFYSQLFALLLFYPLWGITDSTTFHDIFQLIASGTIQSSIMGVGYLGIFSSVVAFVLFCYSVRYIGVTQANAFNNLRPVLTALLMLCAFGEQLPLLKWLGIAVIILGLFICQHKSSPRP